jgi:hypothetical protein
MVYKTTSRRSLFSLVISLVRGRRRVESSSGVQTKRFRSLMNNNFFICDVSFLATGTKGTWQVHGWQDNDASTFSQKVTAMKSRISRPCNQNVEETLGGGGHVYGFALKHSIHNRVSTYVYIVMCVSFRFIIRWLMSTSDFGMPKCNLSDIRACYLRNRAGMWIVSK